MTAGARQFVLFQRQPMQLGSGPFQRVSTSINGIDTMAVRLSTARCCSSRRARRGGQAWPNASPAAGRWLPSTTGLGPLFDALFEPACMYMYVRDWVVSWDGDGQHHDASRVPLRTRPPGRRVTSSL